MSNNDELRRILDMVESGKITAAEGARLLETTQSKKDSSDTRVCPYCAETIPVEDRCPECGSTLNWPAGQISNGSGFHALDGLGKIIVVYTLVVAGLELASHFLPGFISLGMPQLLDLLLSGLGLCAGILMFKGRTTGWTLAAIWAALQIVTIVLHGQPINQQLFHIGYNHSVNGRGLGINLVGIILLVLFIKAKPAANLERN
ncbi:MAG: hypothetical protein JXR25_05835 [Pontiellaceae bacterium]|nr:hypothetical protein [Pontiellaceae bacterium]MBN2784328.1 hypothetical protein [Pontiellaceae bacterium]